jgi:hypothetical protein
MMKKNLFSTGIIFLAVGVVFLISLNKILGTAFMVIGAVFMISSNKRRKKK